MSVLLTAHNLRDDEDAETINISNDQWSAITAASKTFGIEISNTSDHDPVFYSPEVLNKMADRIEQLVDSPKWLRWLAQNGGAHLS